MKLDCLSRWMHVLLSITDVIPVNFLQVKGLFLVFCLISCEVTRIIGFTSMVMTRSRSVSICCHTSLNVSDYLKKQRLLFQIYHIFRFIYQYTYFFNKVKIIFCNN